jgi:2-methylcitrate dehydratase PrpD
MASSVDSTPSVTEAVARFACGQDFRAAPAELFERATRAVIDTVGVAIAGRQEPSFAILADTTGGGQASGEATVLPTRTRASAAQAAWLNGTAGHALDFDDVADELKGHPSVVLVSSLLALAEAGGNSGREFLEAYIVGFEIACALARGLPVLPHYRAGWHATATVGVLAATAAAGRLLRLDETRLRNALGIAASMASGSRQNFGTMTKPLHAGLAARDAVISAQLATNGFTADEHQLEAPMGYFRMYGADPDLSAVISSLAENNVLLSQGVGVKKYPCCYGTHRTADATLALYARGIRAAETRSVSVSVEPGGLQAIIHHQPQTGLQGKFSNEYVVAACLLDGDVKLSTFTDTAVGRADAQDLLRRVTLQEAATPPFGPSTFDHAYAAVEILLSDGTTVRERCDVPRGDGRAPLTADELEAKFRDCLEFAGSDWEADALLTQLRSLNSGARVADVLAARVAVGV